MSFKKSWTDGLSIQYYTLYAEYLREKKILLEL